ncbi:MAG TPA: hypothetical protein PLQ67_05445 [Burkholderiaceae bacterium]|mgnify:CR=1 FL=1|nr:hypothetical protein [Burkholderiaceae bacterium]
MSSSAKHSLAILSAALIAALAAPTWSAEYRLIDSPVLDSARWSASMGLQAPETRLGLAPRHELGVKAPSASATALEDTQATYRYTLLDQTRWAWKVGFKANLDTFNSLWRSGLHTHTAPMLHMRGEAKMSPQWSLSMDADGLLTAKGHALDLGLRVGYHISPSFSLYGGLKLSERNGNAEPSAVDSPDNTANVGIELHF